MTERQIEQAQMYAKEHGDDVIEDDKLEDAFLAGAQSRQAEIDQLTSDVERYKNDVDVGLQREKIARKIIEDKRAEAADLRQFTEWIPVPRDRSGFVEWDIFRLPPAEAYLCRTDNEDLIPYETTYEFTSESQMNHILAVLPIPLYQTKEGDR